ncbi:MAG: chemotaxis protein CheA [Pseudomonadota bacterium]
MSDPMQEIRASFFVECEELLEALNDGLQAMDDGDRDAETINVCFRAVHSIKGGAGAFGLDQLVSFAHVFETAMDAVRDGKLEVTQDILALFFQCGDLLYDLVRLAREDQELEAERLSPVVAQLESLVEAPDEEEDAVDFQPMALSLDLPGLEPLDAGGSGTDEEDGAIDAKGGGRELGAQTPGGPFEITFTPQPELYASGNEPLFLLRALGALGTTETRCSWSDLPPLAGYEAATSLLSWHVTLETEAGEPAIREVFDFVDGLCTLTIRQRPGGTDPSGIPPTSDASPSEEPLPPTPEVATKASPPPPTAELPSPPPAPEAAPVPDTEPTPTPEAVPKPAAQPPKPAAQPKADAKASAAKATVRVDLDRIDRLVNLVGELVINQAMLAQSVAAADLAGNGAIASGLDEFQQLTRDIQDSVMMIRAQPVKSLFQRMGRIVRESASDIGKSVRLITEGEATEIDKTVIERLSDPLTHMIRNAVDHGLEDAETRVAAGKPAQGNVTLTASHRSGRVVIEVSDDGGGINRKRVREKAEEKGLIPPDQALSDSEIDNLLFLPGFSTASEISNLSGRGVGMDVVKTAIGNLGGRITISSDPGVGTTFSISLPLTLAVLDGMVVRVGTETLVVPLSTISETLSLRAGDNRAIGPHTQVVQVRETFVPLIDLGTELGYSAPRESYEGAIVLLIAQEDGSRAALVVDAIEDQRQVVIKGLEESYGHVPGVAAATILGDGQIALILDPADLLANASGLSRAMPKLAEIA